MDELKKIKQELKTTIEAVEIRISQIVEDLRQKLHNIDKENKEILNKIENLEINNRKNNIVIFGLQKNSQDVSSEFITTELNRLIGVNVTESDLNNFYTSQVAQLIPQDNLRIKY